MTQSSERGGRTSPPDSFFRGGMSLKQMSAPQRDAAMKLLATVLSPMGLEKVNEIREADDDFQGKWIDAGPGERGGRAPRWAHRREVRTVLRRHLAGQSVPEAPMVLAFNLGIETMQMLVVVVILPSLMLMSKTRVYPF
jgi:hypothetical protein